MTAQIAERIIVEGKNISLYTNPLSLYLSQNKIFFQSPNTANWRGYIGTWGLIESGGLERLYLVELSAHKTYLEIVGIPETFPGFDKVFAHWFTGELRLPQGKMLKYVHGVYASTYEYDLLIQVKQGVVVERAARKNERPPLTGHEKRLTQIGDDV
jgi:hypothetical protein